MTVTKAYSCNICKKEKPKDDLRGLYFVNNDDFDITYACETEGQHICKPCFDIIKRKKWKE